MWRAEGSPGASNSETDNSPEIHEFPIILSNTRFILKFLSFYTYKGYRPNVPTQIHPVQASIVAISNTSAIYWPSLGDPQCLKIQ